MSGEPKVNLDKFKGAQFALALSGGRDSVALAQCLIEARIPFFAVNVEHGIRGEASLRDSEFVARFCSEKGIRLLKFSVDAPKYAKEHALTIEQAARELRYGIFGKLLEQKECDYVLLAHHADDQTETVLMRILRGTGIRGLAGMSEESGRFLRPLLSFDRADIDAFVKSRNLQFVEDETNSDTAYARNFLREEIKRLKTRYPALNEAVARLVRNAGEAESFLDEAAGAPTVCADGAVKIPLAMLKEPALAKRLIAKAAKLAGVFQDIEERHFNLILDLRAKSNGAGLQLPHKLECFRENESLVFVQNGGYRSEILSDKDAAEEVFDKTALLSGGIIRFHGMRLFSYEGGAYGVNKTDGADQRTDIEFGGGEKSNLVCPSHVFAGGEEFSFKTVLYADLDAVPDGAVLRFRRDGDYIQKFGGGTKSLGDFFTDKKVPKRLRDGIPLLTLGKEVLAATGVEISEKLKIDGETRRVLCIQSLYPQ
jgi:tRNA(Ile)-lysidine synthase